MEHNPIQLNLKRCKFAYAFITENEIDSSDNDDDGRLSL